jgi:hypothetical protein
MVVAKLPIKEIQRICPLRIVIASARLSRKLLGRHWIDLMSPLTCKHFRAEYFWFLVMTGAVIAGVRGLIHLAHDFSRPEDFCRVSACTQVWRCDSLHTRSLASRIDCRNKVRLNGDPRQVLFDIGDVFSRLLPQSLFRVQKGRNKNRPLISRFPQ